MSSEMMTKLKAPFPSDEVKWRIGATNKDKTRGIALAYVTARAVMDRLDEVVGPENWQRHYEFGNGGTIICSIGIKIDEWIWKSDGAGQTDFEGIKGGLSDAFKRAAVSWGIARYLYQLEGKWVPVEQKGKSYQLKEEPKLPEWAIPEEEKEMALESQIEEIKKLGKQAGFTEEELQEHSQKKFSCSLEKLTTTQASVVINKLHKKIKEGA